MTPEHRAEILKAASDAAAKSKKLEKPMSFTHTVCGIEFVVTDVPALERESKGFVTLDVMLRVEQTISMQLAMYGIVTGESFRYMRKTAGMRASDLATLLDVRAETISDWETGKSPVNRAAWGWLAALVAEKAKEGPFATLPMCAAMNGVTPPKKTVIAMLPMK